MVDTKRRGLQSRVPRFDSGSRLQCFVRFERFSGPDGEIGRHKGLKIPRRKPYRFESGSGHHANSREVRDSDHYQIAKILTIAAQWRHTGAQQSATIQPSDASINPPWYFPGRRSVARLFATLRLWITPVFRAQPCRYCAAVVGRVQKRIYGKALSDCYHGLAISCCILLRFVLSCCHVSGMTTRGQPWQLSRSARMTMAPSAIAQ